MYLLVAIAITNTMVVAQNKIQSALKELNQTISDIPFCQKYVISWSAATPIDGYILRPKPIQFIVTCYELEVVKLIFMAIMLTAYAFYTLSISPNSPNLRNLPVKKNE
eukprot:NODE_10_length_61504_cov_0.956502.p55 type:complete len:108 gc:universal NODE_10_length_61504_cov_0.956502:10821-10498(-)